MPGAAQLTGNQAAAEAARLGRIEVFPAFLAFSHPVGALLADMIGEERFQCRFVQAESDRGALAAAAGSSLAGARTFSVAGSRGLASAVELLRYISGLRLPIVVAAANRGPAAFDSPLEDQGDAVAQEAAGWLQLHCESNQEVLDTVLQAFRIAEDRRVLLPVLVNYEGYTLADTKQPVSIPEQEAVDAFLPPYGRAPVDIDRPASINPIASHRLHTEYRFQQHRALDTALEVLEAVSADYARRFGRDWGGAVDPYRAEDAEVLLVAMGSIASTVRRAVDELRSFGRAVGLLKIRSFRPFPSRELLRWLQGARAVAVVDRELACGAGGLLYREVLVGLAAGGLSKPVVGFVAGLGGREITQVDVESMAERALSSATSGRVGGEVVWLNLKIDLVRGEPLSWR